MYKSIFRTTLVILLVFAVSCSDDFLELDNKNALTDGSFYQTQEDFWMALNSLYTPIAHGGVFGLQMQFVFGSFEDRILFETPGMDQLTAINASSGQVSTIYRDLYMGLYRTNMFIKKINERQNVEGLSKDMRNLYIAQARALRGAYLFYLVSIFNEPPFYDEKTIPEDFNIPMTNGNPQNFWDLIKEDFLFGYENLPEQYGPSDAGRITSGAAGAFLGKAMLFKHYYYYVRNGNKGSAEDIADLRLAMQTLREVIQSGNYSLVKPQAPKSRNDYIYALLSNSSYVDLPVGDNLYIAENNQESVWEVQYTDDRIASGWLPGWQWSGALNSVYFSPHGSSFRNHEAHPDLWMAFETEGAPEGFDRDPRAYATVYLDGERMDFREDSPYYRNYLSGLNNKRIARGRGLIPTTDNPFPTNGFGVKKYYFPVFYESTAPLNDPINRRVIRFSDVLLMYAEVTHLLGENTTEGLQALNRVRGRVDMPPVAALTKEAIIHERDVELALESHRWFDLIRWSFDPEWGIDMRQILSRQLAPDGDGSFYIKGKHEFLPLPIREINLSEGNLKQNPGW